VALPAAAPVEVVIVVVVFGVSIMKNVPPMADPIPVSFLKEVTLSTASLFLALTWWIISFEDKYEGMGIGS
jgi:hypothetical protein